MIEENRIQPIHEVYDGLANANSGVLISYHAPTPNMVRLDDIALALSNICRFGGLIHTFYSVAEHTLLVWLLAPPHLKQAALLHDAAEAYVGDVIKPFKNLLGPCYEDYELKFQTVIFQKYGVDQSSLEELKQYDKEATEIEFNYFRLGRLDLISKQTEINELLGSATAKKQLLTLLRSEFLHKVIGS
jgi:5'-deoxynucleotidase YfbR-like HD superfamily hydrolase